MKLSGNKIANIIVGLFVLAGAVMFFTHEPSLSTKGQEVVASPAEVSSPSPTQATAPSEVAAPDLEQITRQLGDFVQAYYTLAPDDTEASRSQRLAQLTPPLTPELIASLDLTAIQPPVSNGEVAVSAVMDRETIEVTDLPNGQVYVVAEIDMKATLADGSEQLYEPIHTASQWQQDAGTWHLIHFAQGGDGH